MANNYCESSSFINVPSDPLLAECRRLVKRWRIQAAYRDPLVWIGPPPSHLIAVWLRSCADELEKAVKANAKVDAPSGARTAE